MGAIGCAHFANSVVNASAYSSRSQICERPNIGTPI